MHYREINALKIEVMLYFWSPKVGHQETGTYGLTLYVLFIKICQYLSFLVVPSYRCLKFSLKFKVLLPGFNLSVIIT